MTQHIGLDHEDVFHEGFTDAIQELLGASAPSLNITIQSPTVLQAVATGENDQQGVAIQGRYRWRTNTTTAALPGSTPDGTHPVFVTGSDNDFNGPLPDPDVDTIYTWALEIRRTADGNPAAEIFRKVGEVDVVSAAITSFRQTVGQRTLDGNPVYGRAPHAAITPLTVRGATAQSALLARFEDGTGAALVTISASGALVAASATFGGNAALTTISAAGGDLSGTLGNLQLVASAVGTTEIADNAVTNVKIPAGAGIPLSKIATDADLTAAGRALLDDANAAGQLTTLGVSTFVQTLLAHATDSPFLTDLGFTEFAKTLRDDANAAEARATLGKVPAADETGLKIIRGRFNGTTATILHGTGWTITRTGVGVYDVTFTTAFSGVPATVATSNEFITVISAGTPPTTSTVRIVIFDASFAPVDSAAIHFISIGPA